MSCSKWIWRTFSVFLQRLWRLSSKSFLSFQPRMKRAGLYSQKQIKLFLSVLHQIQDFPGSCFSTHDTTRFSLHSPHLSWNVVLHTGLRTLARAFLVLSRVGGYLTLLCISESMKMFNDANIFSLCGLLMLLDTLLKTSKQSV